MIDGYWIEAKLDGKPVGTRCVHAIPVETVAVIIQHASERGASVIADSLGFTITSFDADGSLRVVDLESRIA